MKIFLKILAWVSGAVLALALLVQIVLSPKVVGNVVERLSSEYIDGNLSFDRLDVSMFKYFPTLTVDLRNASLTYPSDRYSEEDAFLQDSLIMKAGKGKDSPSDTLACFKSLSASVSLPPLLAGVVRIRKVKLDKPRAFIKFYNDSTANWQMFNVGSDRKERPDSASSDIPEIVIEKVTLRNHPHVVLCMPEDSLFTVLDFQDMSLVGKFETEHIASSFGRVNIDSLILGGHKAGDTLMFALDRAETYVKKNTVFLSADARSFAATRAFGRLKIPFSLESRAHFELDKVKKVSLDRFSLNMAEIPIDVKGEAEFYPDSTYVDFGVDVRESNLDYFVQHFAEIFWEDAKKVRIGTDLCCHADCKGSLVPSEGRMPDLDVHLNKLSLSGSGLDVNASGNVSNLLGKDPLFDVNASLKAVLEEIMQLLPPEMPVSVDGTIDADLSGKIRMSQLNVANFAKADLKGFVKSEHLSLAMPEDSISVYLGKVDADLAATGAKFRDEENKEARMLALTMKLDSLNAQIKESMYFRGKDIQFKSRNSASLVSNHKKGDFYPFGGVLQAKSLSMRDADSCLVAIRNSVHTFSLRPKKSNRRIPVLNVSSKNGSVFLKSNMGRAGISNLNLTATAVMNTLERELRLKKYMDSMAVVYQDVPRDSIASMLRRRTRDMEAVSYIRENDFEGGDIEFHLNESLSKYYRQWDFDAELGMDRLALRTPYYPVRTSVSNLKGHFTNDKVELNDFSLKSGESGVSVKGTVSGLKRFILGKGTLAMDFNIKSDTLNVNEILAALNEGKDVTRKDLEEFDSISDKDYDNAIEETELDTVIVDADSSSSLIVVPSNIDASVRVDAGIINVGELDISSFDSRILMKDRCLQLTNTMATTEVGNIFMDAFYATRNKNDIKSGVNISLNDITVEDVMEVFPQFDTIVPVLRSLSGLVNCDIAVTASLDTMMRVDVPSLNGVLRIKGQDLAVYDNDQYKKLAKLLMFKEKETGYVDSLLIEGSILDSKLEVYPFAATMDRYSLALSGLQNFDTSFKYHVSVLKSPLPMKIGIDLWGDFKKVKFKIGKPKYKDVKSIPVFSKVVDDVRLNLVESIRSIFRIGVDKAVSDNQSQSAIAQYKQRNNYVAAYEMQMDSLSVSEQNQLDSLSGEPVVQTDMPDIVLPVNR